MYQRALIAAPTAALSGRYTSIICVRTRASSSPDACRSRSRATTTRSFSISAWAASRASLACRAAADCSSQPPGAGRSLVTAFMYKNVCKCGQAAP